MDRTAYHGSPVKQSSGFRRSMLMFLAFVYLFVGIAHNISCLDQVVASGIAFEQMSDASDDGTKTGIAICDHCPTCAPAMMPAASVAYAPTAVPAAPVVTAASVIIAGLSRLDTPPPKFLT
ncbi:hypothetical protein [Rhodopseudomonas pseudopalustris]|nr:hypothetical protein [Rhodopseudomonas pseudopalustris]